jgi:asparagine synthase (glutamine-hydrolysing)
VTHRKERRVPGLHLIFSPTDLSSVRNRLAPFTRVHHDAEYRDERLFADSSLELHATRYAEYPVAVLPHDRYTFVIEGRFINPDGGKLESSLEELAGLLFDKGEPDRGRIVDWLMARDGEFVVFIRHLKSGAWGLLNDLLGRLPLYMMRSGANDCMITRELSLFVHPKSGLQPDRMGIAQQLLLGFPAGKRTLLSGVERIPSASLVFWSASEERLRSSVLHTFRFEDEPSNRSLSACADELAASFVAACRQQVEGNRATVLSLSGGMDSRSVAAGLQQAKVPFSAYTFADPFGNASRDLQRAGELARVLHLEWESVPLLPATGADIAQLLSSKPGQISPAQAIDRQFLQHVRSRHGRTMQFFSGDGGDVVLPYLQPDRAVDSARAVVEMILDRYGQAPLPFVAELANVPPADIMAELEAMIAEYPERTFADRYVHYLTYQREIKWSFEGEDRNRGFFRTAAPFLTLSFFRQAMAAPSERKRYQVLYREFLVRLSPEAARVPDAVRGVAITSPEFRRRLLLGSLIARWPKLAKMVRARRAPGGRYQVNSALVRCLRAQWLGNRAVAELFAERWAPALLARPDRYSGELLENLLAISCVMERLDGKADTLAEFAATEFR